MKTTETGPIWQNLGEIFIYPVGFSTYGSALFSIKEVCTNSKWRLAYIFFFLTSTVYIIDESNCIDICLKDILEVSFVSEKIGNTVHIIAVINKQANKQTNDEVIRRFYDRSHNESVCKSHTYMYMHFLFHNPFWITPPYSRRNHYTFFTVRNM